MAAFPRSTMLRTVGILAGLLAVTWGQTTQVSQCTVFQGELPLNTHIAGCDTPPCRLPQLENAVINIIFKAPRTMRSMRTLATAFLSVFGVPFPVPYPLGDQAVTCNFLDNSYCPVLEGEVLQYTLLMFIQETFEVGISANIEFRIEEENGGPLVCIRVPILITAPNTRAGNATISADDL